MCARASALISSWIFSSSFFPIQGDGDLYSPPAASVRRRGAAESTRSPETELTCPLVSTKSAAYTDYKGGFWSSPTALCISPARPSSPRLPANGRSLGEVPLAPRGSNDDSLAQAGWRGRCRPRGAPAEGLRLGGGVPPRCGESVLLSLMENTSVRFRFLEMCGYPFTTYIFVSYVFSLVPTSSGGPSTPRSEEPSISRCWPNRCPARQKARSNLVVLSLTSPRPRPRL